METQRLFHSRGQKFKSQTRGQSQGFALVSLISTLPLLLALTLALGATFNALRRKSLAQALCLQGGMQLQLALKVPLKKLVQLNPKAERLRVARTKADHALEVAVATGNPPAIATAKAAQTAVIVTQTSLRAVQEKLLLEAQFIRMNANRDLSTKIAHLRPTALKTTPHFYRALAVEPKPAQSLSPNYEPIADFRSGQQSDFSFELNVLSGLPFQDLSLAKQKTQCSVSLEEKEGEWKLQIVAAKPRSSWL